MIATLKNFRMLDIIMKLKVIFTFSNNGVIKLVWSITS